MADIIFDDQSIELEQEQTVLSALLERGYDIPNSCRSGICQTCLMQAEAGQVPEESQAGLKDTQKAQGYFMACCCRPQTALKIRLTENNKHICPSDVIEHKVLTDNIVRLRLKPRYDFTYHGGQYITAWKNQTLGRSYSLASVAELDKYLELHIRRIPNGNVSNWLHDDIKPGDTLNIQAAMGQCFYTPGQTQQPLLMAGTGTGLAPLIAIARDALSQKHQAEIHLIHGTTRVEDLYMHKTLLQMTQQHPQFHYYANVLNTEESNNQHNEHTISYCPLDQQLLDLARDHQNCKAYLCGDPDIIQHLTRKLFIAGISMQNIYSDPFLSAAND